MGKSCESKALQQFSMHKWLFGGSFVGWTAG